MFHFLNFFLYLFLIIMIALMTLICFVNHLAFVVPPHITCLGTRILTVVAFERIFPLWWTWLAYICRGPLLADLVHLPLILIIPFIPITQSHTFCCHQIVFYHKLHTRLSVWHFAPAEGSGPSGRLILRRWIWGSFFCTQLILPCGTRLYLHTSFVKLFRSRKWKCRIFTLWTIPQSSSEMKEGFAEMSLIKYELQ